MKRENIYLRALEPADISFLYRWENDPLIWKVSGTIAPYSKFILKRYIENSHLDIYETKQIRFVIVHNTTNIPVGAIDLFDFDPTNRRVGVGILIYDNKQRGKGYASEALDMVITYCFKTLGLHQIYCNIAPDNSSSRALFEKFGFTLTGIKRQWLLIDGKWQDEIMMQLINESTI